MKKWSCYIKLFTWGFLIMGAVAWFKMAVKETSITCGVLALVTFVLALVNIKTQKDEAAENSNEDKGKD